MQILKILGRSFLATALLAGTMGVTLHSHYCMGRLVSVSANIESTDCNHDLPGDPAPCCEDTAQQLKVEQWVPVDFDFAIDRTLYSYESSLFYSYSLEASSIQTEGCRLAYDPPPNITDATVQFRVFLI
ncbi:MAG: hypothetical protein AAF616_08795 [Bacteroidota bacterium]